MKEGLVRKLVNNFNWFFFLAFLVIPLFYFPFPFKEGIPAMVDLPTHYLRARLIFNGYSIYDWYHGIFQGTTPFIFYPPLLSYLIVFVSKISFGVISFDLSFKLLMVLTYIGIPYSLYYSMKILGFEKNVALLAALFSLFISYPPGFGPNAIFEIGLFSNGLAMLFFLPAIAHLDRYLFSEEQSKLFKNLLMAWLFSSLMILSNAVVSLFFIITIFILFIIELVIIKKFYLVKRMFLFFVFLPLLNAFWIFPFLYYQYLSGPDSNWGLMTFSEFIKRYFHGIVFGPIILNILAMFGLVLCFFLLREKKYRIFLVITVIGLCLGLGIFNLSWIVGRVQFAMINRGLSFVGFAIAVFAAVSITTSLRLVKVKEQTSSFIIVLVSIIFCVYALPWISQKSWLIVTETNYTSKQDEEFREVMAWLDKNAMNQVVSIKKNLLDPGLNYTLLDAWIPLKTSALTLDGTFLPQTKFPLKGEILNRFKEPSVQQEEIKEKLVKWGVRYIVLGSSAGIILDPQLFTKIKQIGSAFVYEVVNNKFPVIQRRTMEKNRAVFEVNALDDGLISLPVNYHPNWKIDVGGKLIEFEPDEENLIRLRVTKGLSVIKLIFTLGYIEIISVFVTLITLVICCVVFYVKREREEIWELIKS